MDSPIPAKTVYLDQNILLDLKNRITPSENQSLDNALKSGKVTCVLSPWHWVEASRSQDAAEAIAAARFMDELKPLWLRERVALQKREIQSYLSGKPADTETIAPICQTVSEVASELSGFQHAFVVTSTSDIVVDMRTNPAAIQALKNSYDLNAVAFKKNVQDFKARRWSKKRLWPLVLRSTAKHLGFQSFTERLEQAQPGDLPSLTTEFEIVVEAWTQAGAQNVMKMSPQRLGDHFHLSVALPYVDFIVSGDKGFRNLVKRVRVNLPFATAKVVSSIQEAVEGTDN